MTRFLIILIAVCLAQSAPAATRYVSTNGASSTPPYDSWGTAATNIQNAIFAATNDVVLVTNGTYTCASSLSGSIRAMIIVTNGVTLQSVNGPSVTIVNGGNTGTFTNRCFYISHASAVVSGFTITNGRAYAASPNDAGGGVYLSDGLVTNCVITGNSNTNAPSAGGGGGVYMYYGGVLQNCTIAGNSATNYGGGVYMYGYNGSLVQDCTISNNLVMGGFWNRRGGGVYMTAGGTVTACRITQNVIMEAEGHYTVPNGAGVRMANSNCKLINCLVNNNVSFAYSGGGIALSAGLVSNCVILSNYTSYIGGGIWAGNASSSTDIRIENCTISSNNGTEWGGGISLGGGGIVRNCLISRNRAVYAGGVSMRIWLSPTGMIVNCTIVSNYAGSGGGMRFESWSGDGVLVVMNSIIYSNRNAGAVDNWITNTANVVFSNSCTTPTNNLAGAGNITNWPLFMDYSADNFRLTNNSPCVNRGTNQSWMTTGVDLDGRARIRERTVDIGAYEYLPSGTMVIMH